MSGQIFISYRREDSSASAGRLFDILRNHFDANQIFITIFPQGVKMALGMLN